jgi:hypothetical protein
VVLATRSIMLSQVPIRLRTDIGSMFHNDVKVKEMKKGNRRERGLGHFEKVGLRPVGRKAQFVH